jgi:hypothetical protein
MSATTTLSPSAAIENIAKFTENRLSIFRLADLLMQIVSKD